MRIAITGATGLLGRNLLFEVLKQNLDDLDSLRIFIFGRCTSQDTLRERILKMLATDGLHYIIPQTEHSEKMLNKLEKCLVYVPFDLMVEKLGISEENLKKLKEEQINYFFHLAALSDFRLNKNIQNLLIEINVRGTDRVLDLIGRLKVEEAIYAGTAYSCGVYDEGVIQPHHIDFSKKFRNYYEETKLIAENNFRNYLSLRRIPFRIFRIVGICGRSIELPIGSTSKYDLFYGWASFFLRYKLKALNNLEKIYHHPLELSMRIACNDKAGLNVVSADYAAKIMYAVCVHKHPDNSYHVAAETEIPHRVYLSLILDELKISGYEFVDQEPLEKNELERLYYKSVGKIFGPYLSAKSIKFDRSNLSDVEKKSNLVHPQIDARMFRQLLQFAKDNYFGIT